MDQVQEIKNRLNVVEVVKEYLPQMKQVGTNWKGLCPFHNEKTPSFMVSEEKQIWHCFGCGEGGDVYEFIKKIENVEFPEALRILADKAGIILKKQDPKLVDFKSRLFDLHKEATKFFMAHLWQTHAGKQALTYLINRKLSEETIKEWKIGYAPDSFEALFNYLKKQGFINHEIKESGLIGITKNNKIYDRFRDRIMFPLFDIHGQIVGFTGRLLKEKENQGKYVNSPQTLIYNKSYVVFGLYQAKKTIKQKKRIVFVEGQMDVITAHQNGFTNVVASSGTALTEQQLELVKRYANEIVFAFDADQAGDKAVIKATELALKKDFHVYIIFMPSNEDPDSLIKNNPEKWNQLEKTAMRLMDYFFQKTITKQVNDLNQKKQIAQFLLSLIAKLPNPIDKDFYLKKLADKLSLSELVLRELLDNNSSVTINKKTSADYSKKKINSIQNLSQRLLGILLSRFDLWQATIDVILPEMIYNDIERELYSKLIVYYTENNSDWHIHRLQFDEIKDIVNLNEQESKLLNLLNLLSEDIKTLADKDVDNDWRLIINKIRNNYFKSQIAVLQNKLKKAEVENDSDKIKDITLKISKLISQSKN